MKKVMLVFGTRPEAITLLPQVCEGEASFVDMYYAPDYGKHVNVCALKVEGMDRTSVSFLL